MNSMKRQKDRTLKDELPGLVGDHYATGYNSRKTEEMEPKQKNKNQKTKKHPAVYVTGDRNTV